MTIVHLPTKIGKIVKIENCHRHFIGDCTTIEEVKDRQANVKVVSCGGRLYEATEEIYELALEWPRGIPYQN